MAELKKESYKRGFIVSSGISFILKIAAFFSSVLFAYYFGTNSECDLYFYCISGIGIFAGFLTVFDTAILIPAGMRIQEEKGIEATQLFYNSFLIIIASSCLLLISFAIIITPEKILLLFSKFPADLINSNKAILWLCIPFFLVTTVNMFLVDIIFSYKFFSIGAGSSAFSIIAQITCILIFQKTLQVKSAVIGNLIGNVAQCFFLIMFLKIQCKWKFFSFCNILNRKFVADGMYSIAGNVFSYLAAFVALLCLSGLPEGSVASSNYAQKIIDIINILIISQFSLIIGIKFNELFAKKTPELISGSFYNLGKNILFILVPCCFIISFFSSEIITLFFKRGAFTSVSVKNASFFLTYLILALPCVAINTMIARLFMAAQKLKYSIGYQIVLSAFQILLLIFGVKLFKVHGYIGAILVYNVSNVFCEYFLLKPNFPEINYIKLIRYFGLLIVVNVIPLSILYCIKNYLRGIPLVLDIAAGTLVYCAILFLISYFFKINSELESLCKQIFKKITVRSLGET